MKHKYINVTVFNTQLLSTVLSTNLILPAVNLSTVFFAMDIPPSCAYNTQAERV